MNQLLAVTHELETNETERTLIEFAIENDLYSESDISKFIEYVHYSDH